MKTKLKLLVITVSVLFASCATYYDHYTLTETVQAKVMADGLIKKSIEPYEIHRMEVTQFKQQLQKMQLYERTKDKDPIMIQMWNLLNKEESAVQKFFTTWETQETMSVVFIEEFAPEINKMFDLMVAYESSKDTKAKNALQELLQTLLN